MSYNKDDYEQFMANALKSREDTFRFECRMCGKCCRNRAEPVMVNGADTFRMARALGISTEDAIIKYTRYNLGENSHAPVLALRERPDGSCSLLRKGRCMIQSDKPAVCALYPLGRIMDMQAGSITYFVNPHTCIDNSMKKVWTLGEWLDAFDAEKTERMSAAWNRLFFGISALTHKMSEKNITKEMQAAMTIALYMRYDTSRDFYEQVEDNKIYIQRVFLEEFRRKIKFNQ